jgi:hypothetical protein
LPNRTFYQIKGCDNLERIIIAGGRDFTDYKLLEAEVCWYLLDIGVVFDGNDNIEFVLGGARGADSLGERFANEYGFKKKMFIPDWSVGKKAGILRNHEMGDYANHLIAFWDERSSGTKDMINYATKKGLKVKVVKYEPIVWEYSSETVGNGFDVVFNSFYKQEVKKYSREPVGEKIKITYQEYDRGGK